MRDRDMVSEWFAGVASLGEYASIRFGRVREAGDAPAWIHLPHERFDGVGGFAHLLREHGHPSLARLPRLAKYTTPHLPRILAAWARFATVPRPRWRWPSLPSPRATPEAPPAVAYRVYPRDATRTILARSKSSRVTVTTLLLDRASRMVRRRLADGPREVAWMLPVNLRGPLRKSRDTANHSSFVDLRSRAGESPTALQARIRASLEGCEHWATWYAIQADRLRSPARRALYLARAVRETHTWVGALSNLGAWDPPPASDPPHAWIVCSLPLPTMPLGIGCVTYRGRLSLSLQLHPTLTTEASIAEAWLADLTEGLS